MQPHFTQHSREDFGGEVQTTRYYRLNLIPNNTLIYLYATIDVPQKQIVTMIHGNSPYSRLNLYSNNKDNKGAMKRKDDITLSTIKFHQV
jgi:hypothetical protein